MKKLKLSITMMALVIGVTGAFAFKPARTTTSAGSGYYWFDPTVTVYHDQNTQADEQSATGCNGTGDICEQGYNANQLNTPGVGSSGVKSSEVGNPQDKIYQAN